MIINQLSLGFLRLKHFQDMHLYRGIRFKLIDPALHFSSIIVSFLWRRLKNKNDFLRIFTRLANFCC